MKKLMAILMAACMALISVACGHKHTWNEATCTTPKTCTECGAIEGEAIGHTWVEATCTKPKTCSVCGATEGKALGHKAGNATCTEPAVCTVCGETVKQPLGHQWADATCTKPKTCSVCGATEGQPLGHDWQAATIVEPKTCKRCGLTEGEPVSVEVYDKKGFLISKDSFMLLYDRALVEVKDGWDAQHNDGWSNLSATPRLLRQDGYLSYNTQTDGYKIRICHEGRKWLEHSAYLSFEGNPKTDPWKQVAVMLEADYLLKTSYANVRYMVICMYAALPLAIDPDVKTADDALTIVLTLFTKASGGKDIFNKDTKALSNVPVSNTQNGVTYTLTVNKGIIYLFATIETKPVL